MELREIKLLNGFNFRDIGGYKTCEGLETKWHKIVRSGYLSELSQFDQHVLFRYGIRNIIDLRTDKEVSQYPDKYNPAINYINVPILDSDLTQSMARDISELDYKSSLQHMRQVYSLMITDKQAQKAYHKIMELLAENNNCTLIHCSAGKDRTGIVIILFLKLLGVNDRDVLNDYLMTNEASSLRINNRMNEFKEKGASFEKLKAVFNLSTVNYHYYEQAQTIITKGYNGFESYFYNQLGIDQCLKEKLKKKYLC